VLQVKASHGLCSERPCKTPSDDWQSFFEKLQPRLNAGGKAPKNCSRRKRLCAVFLRHILRLLVLLRKPLFATAKRQLPRTLSAIAHNRENNLNHWKNKYR